MAQNMYEIAWGVSAPEWAATLLPMREGRHRRGLLRTAGGSIWTVVWPAGNLAPKMPELPHPIDGQRDDPFDPERPANALS
jgi:hypothetical protein